LAAQQRKLPIELAVFIVSRVARGLAYAHAKRDLAGNPMGIVHRDVSPKNIMIAFEGDVKLTDFGIAKARGYLIDKEGEEVAGKAEFMSPEQADFQITDKRSDIFSAGVVLSQLLTGQNIFRGQSPEASRKRIMHTPIPDFTTLNPEIEPRLNALLARTLSRDLGQRYQSADDLLYDLEYFIYHRGYGPTNETLGRFVRELFADDLNGGATRHKPPGPTSASKTQTGAKSKKNTLKQTRNSSRQTRHTVKQTAKTPKHRVGMLERLKNSLR
jgi:serine/threonine-protein kinase